MKQQTVLVTGANSGFGKLIALTFARNGYHVYATSRGNRPEQIDAISKIARQERLSLEWLTLDITNPDQISAALQRVSQRGIDVLINNAGFGILGPIESYTTIDVQKQLDTNFLGTVRMIYAFLPLLKQSGHGRIINMSSIAGVIVAPAYGLYAASKHAVEVFSEALRYELFDTNVSVSLVEPGGFDTNFSANAKSLATDEAAKKTTWYARAIEVRNKHIGAENNIINKKRDPQLVADFVLKIAQAHKPKLHNFIGPGTHLGYLARRFLPNTLWEWAMITALKKLSR